MRSLAMTQPIGDNPGMSPIGFGLLLGFVLYLLLAAYGYWQAGMLVWFAASVGGWMDHRRERPVPLGHCRQCGYDLTGNVSGTCPECGVIRKFILITGTTLCVLIAAAFVVSAWWCLQIGIRGGPLVSVLAGAIDFWWPSGMQWYAGCDAHWGGLQYALSAETLTNGVTVPIVYPFAAVAIPTACVWRFGRKRVKPGRCRCGYDLTGNTSGRFRNAGRGWRRWCEGHPNCGGLRSGRASDVARSLLSSG